MGVLKSLIDAYETLRQCEPGVGFITCQLAHRYDKHLRREMQEEWDDELTRLRRNVACHVMNLMLVIREMVSHPQAHPLSQGGELHLVNFVANDVPYRACAKGSGLRLAFTLDGVTASTLLVPSTTQPVWEDGIVTLPLGVLKRAGHGPLPLLPLPFRFLLLRLGRTQQPPELARRI